MARQLDPPADDIGASTHSWESLTAVTSTPASTVDHALVATTAGSATDARNAVARSPRSRSTQRHQRDDGAFRRLGARAAWRWVPARLLPAASLIMLMVWQLTALLADGKTALAHPSWLVIAGLRERFSTPRSCRFSSSRFSSASRHLIAMGGCPFEGRP